MHLKKKYCSLLFLKSLYFALLIQQFWDIVGNEKIDTISNSVQIPTRWKWTFISRRPLLNSSDEGGHGRLYPQQHQSSLRHGGHSRRSSCRPLLNTRSLHFRSAHQLLLSSTGQTAAGSSAASMSSALNPSVVILPPRTAASLLAHGQQPPDDETGTSSSLMIEHAGNAAADNEHTVLINRKRNLPEEKSLLIKLT